MAPRFIARQLSHPFGFRGWVIGKLMNRYNARANEFAVRQLSIQPKDRILEIGFGGELTIPAMPIQVTGIDRSEEMVRQAMHKFCKSVEAGRADFRAGNWKSFRLNQRRLATCSRSTRSISGHRLKPALMRFVVFSRPAAGPSSGSCRRNT
jgi:ubiquinone/menaquinone biosynthesis C-methylase UbiE